MAQPDGGNLVPHNVAARELLRAGDVMHIPAQTPPDAQDVTVEADELRTEQEVHHTQLGSFFRLDSAQTVLQKSGENTENTQRPQRCTPNIQFLATSAFLFALITVAQIFAAHIAKSQALLMDCISMGTDALTYTANIFVECKKRDGGEHVILQLVVVGLSLSCLTYFTVDASMDSWGTVQVCQGSAKNADDEDDVNGWITLAFAIVGMGFDLICFWFFHRGSKKRGEARHVNVFSALLHVLADCLRSASTIVMSLLILFGGYDSTCLDAYTSIFIGATIVVGTARGFYSWLGLLMSYCRGRTFWPSVES